MGTAYLGAGGIPKRHWADVLLHGIQFAEGVLNRHDQKAAFRLWVLSLFFPQIFPTRIVLALIGEKGSGKSSLLRRLGQLLFGPAFNVTALTSKPDDFDAAITTDPFVVADNADDAPKWFPDRLAVVATGGTIKRRNYYTTNSLGEFHIRARLAVTSRTPNFQREDVAERLLPLDVQRMDQFIPEGVLLRDIQENRADIMKSLLLDVQRAIIELKNQAGENRRTTFRMADFADFALKVAPVVSTRTRQEMPTLLESACQPAGHLCQRGRASAAVARPMAGGRQQPRKRRADHSAPSAWERTGTGRRRNRALADEQSRILWSIRAVTEGNAHPPVRDDRAQRPCWDDASVL